jgi:hypothetical protein
MDRVLERRRRQPSPEKLEFKLILLVVFFAGAVRVTKMG